MRRIRQENYFPIIVGIHFLMWAVDLSMYSGTFHDAETDTFLYGLASAEPGELSASRVFGEMLSSWVVTVFAFNFLMATRIRWVERLFGGLDKMYLIHRRSGKIAVVLLLAHFLFVPRDLTVFTLGKPFGFYAMIGILLGVLLAAAPALKRRIPYHRWLPIHRLMGMFYVAGICHAFLVHALIWELPLVRMYVFSMAAIGVAAWAYKTFMHPFLRPIARLKVSMVTQIGDVVDVRLSGPEVKRRAGQFGFVTFPAISKEAHPFTIASPPGEDPRLLIKDLGDYTSGLAESVKEGDEALFEAPFGHFSPDHARHSQQVWIAGGIGITPFLAMMAGAVQDNVTAFWSVADGADPLIAEVQKHAASSGISLQIWNSSTQGYMNLDHIGQCDWKNTSFMLCGPAALKTAFTTALRAKEVHRDDIHDEEFAFR